MRVNRIRRGPRKAADAISRAVGYELVRRHFYSPIPDVESLPPEVWTGRSELRGLELHLEAGFEFLRSDLSPFIAEFRPPVARTADPRDYYLDNGFYGALDAHTLYAIVRRFRPRVVLELGSGMSSLVIADAFRAAGGSNHQHVIYDPFPRPDLAPVLRAVAELRTRSAVEVSEAEISRLRPGDVLFVDTSHTVKIGGDVNTVILDLLPLIEPGVLVHIHDIYLPWEYPREFMEERRFFWAEQYLLQAFLAFNRSFEVVLANHALWRAHPREVMAVLGDGISPRYPSALWLRRIEA